MRNRLEPDQAQPDGRRGGEEPLVVPGVTDEDPMTSRRVTRQPRKKNPAAAVVEKLGKLGRKKR